MFFNIISLNSKKKIIIKSNSIYSKRESSYLFIFDTYQKREREIRL